MTIFEQQKPGSTVLLFSAAVGGGHLAAAQTVERLANEEGHQAVIVDGLNGMSCRLSRWVIGIYHWILAHTPWIYRFLFWIFSLGVFTMVLRWTLGRLWGRRLLETIEVFEADAIVSTYPLVTAALGYLVSHNRLNKPVIAVVSDYGVHPMWVSPPIDLHLVVSDASRRLVEAHGGRARTVRLPVGDEFRAPLSREAARAKLGLPRDAFIPLIVGGAWGVGNLEGAAEIAIEAGAYPVIVTGRNAHLKADLDAQFPDPERARIIGWTGEMAALMKAADCLIQNAGGVTCLEANEARLPVVIYQPIPGHGLLNASLMEESGAAYWPRNEAELRGLLTLAAAGIAPLAPPRQEGVELRAALVFDPPGGLLPLPPGRMTELRWPA
jgi:UDP-N-acetylglucosamine:LPS N-acetylglucosamine transferase